MFRSNLFDMPFIHMLFFSLVQISIYNAGVQLKHPSLWPFSIYIPVRVLYNHTSK